MPLPLNERRVLDQLAAEPAGLTRAELGAATGLSRPTISRVFEALRAQGMVIEQASPGPTAQDPDATRAARIVLSPPGWVLGVDVGHGHIRSGAAQIGKPTLATEPETIDDVDVDLEGPAAMRRAAQAGAAALKSAGVDLSSVRAIGLGFPAPLSEGLVAFPSFLPSWGSVHVVDTFRSAMEKELGGPLPPVVVSNDANVGALGEQLNGAGKGCRHFIYVKISTGIGMGLMLGRLYQGAHGVAGEFGHVRSSPKAEERIETLSRLGPEIPLPTKECERCKKPDCLENLASTGAIISQLAATDDHYSDDTRIQQVIKHATEDVLDHPLCHRAIRDAGIRIGYALADVVRVLNPERVILGGMLAGAGEMLRAVVAETIQADTVGSIQPDVRVVSRGRIERSEVEGAIALALGTATREARDLAAAATS